MRQNVKSFSLEYNRPVRQQSNIAAVVMENHCQSSHYLGTIFAIKFNVTVIVTWYDMTWYWYVMCGIKLIKVGSTVIARRVRSIGLVFALDSVGFGWLLVAQPVLCRDLNTGGTLYEP